MITVGNGELTKKDLQYIENPFDKNTGFKVTPEIIWEAFNAYVEAEKDDIKAVAEALKRDVQ